MRKEWYLYQKGINQLWWFPDWDAQKAIDLFKRFKNYLSRHEEELKEHPLYLDLVEVDKNGNEIGRRNYYHYELSAN